MIIRLHCGIEGARFGSEISHTRTDLTAWLSWQSIGLVFQIGRRFDSHPWPGIFFKLARCGYALRVTSQASYSPEYIALTRKKLCYTSFTLSLGGNRLGKNSAVVDSAFFTLN